eukprot:3903593-Prymnesium_polylepis.1
MVRCVDVLDIDANCSVLEVGFGCGYSAERIQRAKPRRHTIVECADVVLERLRPWAAARPGVEVCEGTWQQMLPSLGVYDIIFFDDFGAPGLAEAEMEQCADAAYRARYAAARSHMHAFLDMVLEWHSRPGTRISGYLSGTPIHLDRADTVYSSQRMPVRPPSHCHYFDDRVAVVPLWVKGAAAADKGPEPAPAAKQDASEKGAAAASTDDARQAKRKREEQESQGE